MFDKAQNNKLYEDIVAQICSMILDGTIKKGSLLPSEARLCEQFGVSRTTVREALGILSQRKIIKTIHGKGSVVISDSFNFLNEGLRTKILQFESNFEYATQARLILEPQIAFLAAQIATKKDIEDLQSIIKLCDEKEKDGTLTTEDLRTFHLRIVDITKNPVLISIIETLVAMCDAPEDTNLKVPNPGTQAKPGILCGHDKVYQAIKNGNCEDAYFYMKENLKEFHDNCLNEY